MLVHVLWMMPGWNNEYVARKLIKRKSYELAVVNSVFETWASKFAAVQQWFGDRCLNPYEELYHGVGHQHQLQPSSPGAVKLTAMAPSR